MQAKIFAQRRQRLLSQLQPGEMVVVANAPVAKRSREVNYRYRPDSDFFYLTGFAEAHAIAVLLAGRAAGEYILFCQTQDPIKERWEGRRVGLCAACEEYGAHEAFPIEEFSDRMVALLASSHSVYYPIGRHALLDTVIVAAVHRYQESSGRGPKGPIELKNIEYSLHEQRLIKSADELRCLQQAIDVSMAGHCRIIERCQPGLMEYELEAELCYEFTRSGCVSHAYPPIVAAGENACILHYIDNHSKLRDGDLLLVDAGAEYQYYAADITRTIPINGQFSAPQQAIYEIVLHTQATVIDAIKPGVSFELLNKIAAREITQGLIDVGLLTGSCDGLLEQQAYRPFYMHGVGHWLGLDVHDVGLYQRDQQWRPFEPNMVFTVEPGIYIAADANVPAKWQGVAVRIEDDICVTASGCRVLSQALPKTVAAITHMMTR